MLKLNLIQIQKIVNKAFYFIAIIAYLLTPLYCYGMYVYMPVDLEAAKELWETKNKLLDIVSLLTA